MTIDAFPLTIVFSILPVIPFAVLQAHHFYGMGGACTTAALFYLGYPATFGALMWRSQSK